MAELLALVYVGYVDLNDGTAERAYAVLQGHAGMGVGAGVEHNAVVSEAYFLHLVDKYALDVALEVLYLYVGKASAQLRQVVVERAAAVNPRFARAQKVKVGAV